MWYNLVYQDYAGGKMMLVSSHRSLTAAQRKQEKQLADPFWCSYVWSIHTTTKRPPRSPLLDFREYLQNVAE